MENLKNKSFYPPPPRVFRGLAAPARRYACLCLTLLFSLVILFSGCKSSEEEIWEEQGTNNVKDKDKDKGNEGGKPVTLNASVFSGPADGLESAIDMIRAARSENKPSLSLLLEAGTESVDLTAKDTNILGGLVLTSANSPDEVTIDGKGRVITLTGEGKGSVITVGFEVTLTLRDITFVGLNDNNAALITVANGGTLVLEGGTVITGNTSSNSGGGVAVKGGGRFTMRGGTISDNKATGNNKSGGGVYTEGFSLFTMSGGTISGNQAKSMGGGVFVSSNGVFTKTMGTIYGNEEEGGLANTVTDESSNAGFAVGVAGGGLYRNKTAGENVSLNNTIDENWGE
ncbi:MAG: hypothetical protein LBK66_03755 [Spirochaetaceae bacterium]|jgi:hypothetical protein|nr:hypothetical protein [Spirochaetaceae bacterium]